MIHTTNPVIKHKAGLLNLAEELSNVSKACKIMGVSCDTFYRYRELVDEGGVDELINRPVHQEAMSSGACHVLECDWSCWYPQFSLVYL